MQQQQQQHRQLTSLSPELLREMNTRTSTMTRQKSRSMAATATRSSAPSRWAAGGESPGRPPALLYEKISINRVGRVHQGQEQRLVMLNRSCRTSPQLVHRIRSAELRWFHNLDEAPQCDDFLAHPARFHSMVSVDCRLRHLPSLLPGDPAAGETPLCLRCMSGSPGGFAAPRELRFDLNRAEDNARAPWPVSPDSAEDQDSDGGNNNDGGGERVPTIGLTELGFGYWPSGLHGLAGPSIAARCPALLALHMSLLGTAVDVDRDRHWPLATWKQPGGDRLRDLARAAAVDLKLSLCVPRSFRSEGVEVICEADHFMEPGNRVV